MIPRRWPTDAPRLRIVVASPGGFEQPFECGVHGRATLDMLQQAEREIQRGECAGIVEAGEYLCDARWVVKRVPDGRFEPGYWDIKAVAFRSIEKLTRR